MPFEVGHAVNSVANAALDAPGVRRIAKNPVYTAVVIVLIVLLIVSLISGISARDAARAGFWSAIAATGIVFVNNNVLMSEMSSDNDSEKLQHLFDTELPPPATFGVA